MDSLLRDMHSSVGLHSSNSESELIMIFWSFLFVMFMSYHSIFCSLAGYFFEAEIVRYSMCLMIFYSCLFP